MKIKKNDNVQVIKGKDKGKTGTVEKVFTLSGKVLIAGVNEFKRHLKGRGQGQKSEIVTITKPVRVENVVLICPKCNMKTRVAYSMQNDKKVRMCKKCQQALA